MTRKGKAMNNIHQFFLKHLYYILGLYVATPVLVWTVGQFSFSFGGALLFSVIILGAIQAITALVIHSDDY